MTTETQLAANPKRRWHQFVLRTLLIVTALITVAWGMSLRWIAPAHRQRATVKWVEDLGGEVAYTDARRDELPIVTKLRNLLPRDYFDDVSHVFLFDTKVIDADLAHLNGLPTLQWLDLFGTEVTDAGLAHLENLTALEELDLENTQVTDIGLVYLKGRTSLQGIRLRNTQVTDAGLAHLKDLTNLQTLDLRQTQVTDLGIVDLKKALPKCKISGP